MRKIITGLVTLTLIITLLSGCNSVNSSDDKNETAIKTEANQAQASQSSWPKVSVNVPEGWEEQDGVALAQYMKGSASFIVTCDSVPADVEGSDDYVEFAKSQFQEVFDDTVFSKSQDITVNGMEGREFDFTASVSGMKMKYRIVYILEDSQAYTLTCGTFDEQFDTVEAEYQSIIDSFKIL